MQTDIKLTSHVNPTTWENSDLQKSEIGLSDSVASAE